MIIIVTIVMQIAGDMYVRTCGMLPLRNTFWIMEMIQNAAA